MRQDQPLSYKTKACRSFARTGRCPYGPRCRFMHGDAREAQQLAALRLASDERPGVPPYSLDGAAGSAGAIFGLPQPQPGLATPMSASATASGLQPGGMGVVPGINDEHILAQLLARRTSGSSSECASEATSETPSRPGVLPLPHPTTSSHAVLLPYAQLPHGDLSKQPGAAMLAWGAYLDPAQLSPPSAPAPTHMPPPMASHLAQPGGGGASSRTSPSGASCCCQPRRPRARAQAFCHRHAAHCSPPPGRRHIPPSCPRRPYDLSRSVPSRRPHHSNCRCCLRRCYLRLPSSCNTLPRSSTSPSSSHSSRTAQARQRPPTARRCKQA